MDSFRKFEELNFRQQLEQIDALRDENTKGLFEVIEMKNKRLTYNEARIEALEKHIEKLNIEILELEFKLKQAQNAINE
jgi:branched-subunit amino acid aminotransferase/4-amino-4-deoxychorismate lyase